MESNTVQAHFGIGSFKLETRLEVLMPSVSMNVSMVCIKCHIGVI